jgi:3-methyladenine DNA glycosylase/8-oxoguanine DNA glycosylase
MQSPAAAAAAWSGASDSPASAVARVAGNGPAAGAGDSQPGAAGGPPPDAPGDPGVTREWRAPFVLDLPRTVGVHARGHGDPAFRVTPDGCIWRTSLTPEGPGTLRIAPARPASPEAAPGALLPEATLGARPPEATLGARPPEATLRARPPGAPGAGAGAVTVIRAAAWGPGAAWLLRELPALLGGDDDRAGFAPAHPVLRELSARHPGVRVGRSGRVLEALVPAVLEQKVVGVEARRAWRYLLLKFGDPAPGPAPAGMRVPPPPAIWRRIPSWEWHRAGVEGVRARTIIGAAEVAGRLEEIVTMPSGAADRRLRSLPGIGVWTSAEVRQRACGDADAVSVGDYHLPSAVGWALAGRVVDDAGMLELLAPYAGHRHRAARLVELGGIRPPRRGPRMSVRDYRAF